MMGGGACPCEGTFHGPAGQDVPLKVYSCSCSNADARPGAVQGMVDDDRILCRGDEIDRAGGPNYSEAKYQSSTSVCAECAATRADVARAFTGQNNSPDGWEFITFWA